MPVYQTKYYFNSVIGMNSKSGVWGVLIIKSMTINNFMISDCIKN